MFHTPSEHELRNRAGTFDDVAGATGMTDTRRTVAGTAVLSAVPVAFVAAASYPVVAAAVLTVTVAAAVAGRHVSGDTVARFTDRAANDGPDGPASMARPTD